MSHQESFLNKMFLIHPHSYIHTLLCFRISSLLHFQTAHSNFFFSIPSAFILAVHSVAAQTLNITVANKNISWIFLFKTKLLCQIKEIISSANDDLVVNLWLNKKKLKSLNNWLPVSQLFLSFFFNLSCQV